jgi:hypothetical protein
MARIFRRPPRHGRLEPGATQAEQGHEQSTAQRTESSPASPTGKFLTVTSPAVTSLIGKSPAGKSLHRQHAASARFVFFKHGPRNPLSPAGQAGRSKALATDANFGHVRLPRDHAAGGRLSVDRSTH